MSDFSLLACLSLQVSSITVADFVEERVSGALFGWPDEIMDRAKRVQEDCARAGVTILHPAHVDYPSALFGLEDPPLFLACLGEPSWKRFPCLAVVGSREPSVAAIEWMEIHLSRFLKCREVMVASGGARGIDQKAHLLSLRAGRPTVAFLPSGVRRVYPREFRDWIDEILAGGGAVLSEYPPAAEMHRANFEKRNRMIAALGCLVFVVEARRQSGSCMTARFARDLGREVAIVPASPLDARAAGTVDLMFDGGQPVRDAADLLQLFNEQRTRFGW